MTPDPIRAVVEAKSPLDVLVEAIASEVGEWSTTKVFSDKEARLACAILLELGARLKATKGYAQTHPPPFRWEDMPQSLRDEFVAQVLKHAKAAPPPAAASEGRKCGACGSTLPNGMGCPTRNRSEGREERANRLKCSVHADRWENTPWSELSDLNRNFWLAVLDAADAMCAERVKGLERMVDKTMIIFGLQCGYDGFADEMAKWRQEHREYVEKNQERIAALERERDEAQACWKYEASLLSTRDRQLNAVQSIVGLGDDPNDVAGQVRTKLRELESTSAEWRRRAERAENEGLSNAMVREIAYMNDDYEGETPEVRWARMRAWTARQIIPEVSP